jgi:D-glycero-alpha-D-manno-heptose 1-phosphate guanylyltransferase
MDSIILAGGMGTRLRKAVPDLPKPMAPVRGKPFLFYLLLWIKQYQIDKIILSIGYKPESFSEYFGDFFDDIPVIYVTEEKPLGTGGAVINALDHTKGNDILILNGDTWFPVDLDKLYDFHLRNNSRFTIALKRMRNFSRYGSVEISGDTIIRFHEKNFCSAGFINGGIYLVKRDYFESGEFPEVFSLEKEILEKEAEKSQLKGVVFDDPFIDIGLPEDYRKAGNIIKISTTSNDEQGIVS